MRSATAVRWESLRSSGVSMRQGAPIASNVQADGSGTAQASASSLIAAIAILKPPLVSDEPETRVTLSWSMSWPTT